MLRDPEFEKALGMNARKIRQAVRIRQVGGEYDNLWMRLRQFREHLPHHELFCQGTKLDDVPCVGVNLSAHVIPDLTGFRACAETCQVFASSSLRARASSLGAR